MARKSYSKKKNYSRGKKSTSSKRNLNEIRSYWVGVGIALGHVGGGNVNPYFEKARYEKSLSAGFEKEMGSLYKNTPSFKANLFK